CCLLLFESVDCGRCSHTNIFALSRKLRRLLNLERFVPAKTNFAKRRMTMKTRGLLRQKNLKSARNSSHGGSVRGSLPTKMPKA
ncbi:unnamed protein product, partial [Cyprideis torosa]